MPHFPYVMIVAAVAVGVGLLALWSTRERRDEEELGQREPDGRYDAWSSSRYRDDFDSFSSQGSLGLRYSNPNNNHDDSKFQHPTRESAEKEIERMRSDPYYTDTDRLRSYYNDQLGAWFVGNSKYD